MEKIKSEILSSIIVKPIEVNTEETVQTEIKNKIQNITNTSLLNRSSMMTYGKM